MTKKVAIVSCVYGEYGRFIERWEQAVCALNRRPDEIIVAADRPYPITAATAVVINESCPWQHRQAFYLNTAIAYALSDWVCIVDIDDEVFPDALDGIDGIGADVWQLGYESSHDHGEVTLPTAMTNDEYLASPDNCYVSASAFRRDAFMRVGGYPDVALQDWALWRRLAAAGATFEHSTRAHFRYNRHADARTFVELTNVRRQQHRDELAAALA